MSKIDKTFFEKYGYTVARSVFNANEVKEMVNHFMDKRAEGPKPGDMGGDSSKGADDPLNSFPRMINMHDWDTNSDNWQKDERLRAPCRKLVNDEIELGQTMLYFKPPGSRGQGLHQDNQYLRRYPIIAAWTALDRCDTENGQMILVPGSHTRGILPVEPADPAISFVGGQTVIPEGAKEVGIDMEAGDVLFFGGFVIHGSYPNKTTDRFRRSFICHFYAAQTQELQDDESGKATSMSELRHQTAARK